MNYDDLDESRDLMLNHVRRILDNHDADTAELEIVRKFLNDTPVEDPWYDEAMGERVQEILRDPEPHKSALELARKYLNDVRKRSFERSMKELDPAATAMAKYGIKFDDFPRTVEDLVNGTEDD